MASLFPKYQQDMSGAKGYDCDSLSFHVVCSSIPYVRAALVFFFSV